VVCCSVSFGKLFAVLLSLWVQAAAVAQTAAKSIADMQDTAEDSESSKDEGEAEDSTNERESEDEKEKIRKSALDKLEKASEESIFGQASHKYEC
jgi:cytoskeletal protein RodZ